MCDHVCLLIHWTLHLRFFPSPLGRASVGCLGSHPSRHLRPGEAQPRGAMGGPWCHAWHIMIQSMIVYGISMIGWLNHDPTNFNKWGVQSIVIQNRRPHQYVTGGFQANMHNPCENAVPTFPLKLKASHWVWAMWFPISSVDLPMEAKNETSPKASENPTKPKKEPNKFSLLFAIFLIDYFAWILSSKIVNRLWTKIHANLTNTSDAGSFENAISLAPWWLHQRSCYTLPCGGLGGRGDHALSYGLCEAMEAAELGEYVVTIRWTLSKLQKCLGIPSGPWKKVWHPLPEMNAPSQWILWDILDWLQPWLVE